MQRHLQVWRREECVVVLELQLMINAAVVESRRALEFELYGSADDAGDSHDEVLVACGFGVLYGHEVNDFANTFARQIARDEDCGIDEVELFDDGILVGTGQLEVTTLFGVEQRCED